MYSHEFYTYYINVNYAPITLITDISINTRSTHIDNYAYW